MDHDTKSELCTYLLGSKLDLAPALSRLGITDNLMTVAAEIEDTVARCRTCRKWTDADVMDQGRCPRCDEVLNPENRETLD